jgi:hypothetical protein
MHRYSSWAIVGLTLFGAGLAVNACSAADDTGNATTQAGTMGVGGAGGTATTATTGTGGNISVGSAVGGGNCNGGTPDDDKDGDGITETQGDCNDCDEFVNPDAVEVIAEATDGGTPPPTDEDCDGIKDNVAPPCDTGLALDSLDPMDAVKAIGLCKYVQQASWVVADGSAPPVDPTQLANFHMGHGNLPNLGPNNAPREGAAILALSSGIARNAGDPAFSDPAYIRNFQKGYTSNSPFGFPKESPSCPGTITGPPNDATGVEIEVKAPSNAQGYSFDFNFFTHEWPQYICKEFNDFFVAIMEPFPQGQTDGNISFDMLGNPISVNNAFLDVCGCPNGAPCIVPPGMPVKSFDCASGTAGLVGTVFATDTTPGGGWSTGSSGWLRTSAPVAPGETFKIRLVTYDSADQKVDSTTLVDNWKWQAKPGTVGTIVVPD